MIGDALRGLAAQWKKCSDASRPVPCVPEQVVHVRCLFSFKMGKTGQDEKEGQKKKKKKKRSAPGPSSAPHQKMARTRLPSLRR